MTDTMAVSVELLVSRYNAVTGNSEILLKRMETPTATLPSTPETEESGENTPSVELEAVYALPQAFMSVNETGDQCVDRLIESLGATEQIVEKANSGVFTAVDRIPEQRTIGLLYASQLTDDSDLTVENGEWFTCSSELTKVLLSTSDKTIIAYRDGRAIGDATLAFDHSTMITSVM